MPRLFTGIALPGDVVATLADVEEPLPGASWIEADDLHLTLRFAGDIDNRLAHEFAEELARIDADVFEMAIEGIGVFGGNDPKVLWAGVRPCAPLDALARAHERAARSVGLAPVPRPFRAHVTLARLRNVEIQKLTDILARRALLRTRPFVVEEFLLYSSRPRTGGGPYVVEDAFRLRGARPDEATFDVKR